MTSTGNPADAGGNNVYDVVVAASDGSFTDTMALTVSVLNANEGLSFTSATSATIQENGTSVATVAATDIDGNAVTYAIAGGADAALFTIDANTGALSFIAAPDFEAPTDADANNVYDVILSATDGSFVDTQAIAVTVGNVNEAVAITSNGAGEASVVNGTVSGADELSFVNDKPGAKSDLDGLSAFDSNGDGQFSALDGNWSSFSIWQDRNSDGAVDTGELGSLASAGVSAINLIGQAVNKTWGWNDNLTLNNGQFTRDDGSVGRLADVALSYQSNATRKADIHSIGVSAELEALRAAHGPLSRGLQGYLTLPDVFDYFGGVEGPVNDKPMRQHQASPRANDTGLSRLETRVNLMRQDMVSFGVRNGEGSFGSQREQRGIHDFFA